MIRGLADLLVFSVGCGGPTAAFLASSAPARRRGWFCMRGRLGNDEAMDALAALDRSIRPPPAPGYHGDRATPQAVRHSVAEIPTARNRAPGPGRGSEDARKMPA